MSITIFKKKKFYNFVEMKYMIFILKIRLKKINDITNL